MGPRSRRLRQTELSLARLGQIGKKRAGLSVHRVVRLVIEVPPAQYPLAVRGSGARDGLKASKASNERTL